MKGIQFLVDDTGKKTAVLIDLKEHGQNYGRIFTTHFQNQRAINRGNPPILINHASARRMTAHARIGDKQGFGPFCA